MDMCMGRPSDCKERISQEIRSYDLLDNLIKVE